MKIFQKKLPNLVNFTHEDKRWISTNMRLVTGGNRTDGKIILAKRERELNKADKEVFDWHLKAIKMLHWIFPKISNCTCPLDDFPVPVPVAKRTGGNPPKGISSKMENFVNKPVEKMEKVLDLETLHEDVLEEDENEKQQRMKKDMHMQEEDA